MKYRHIAVHNQMELFARSDPTHYKERD